MAHSYRLGLVTWGYQVWIPFRTDICHRGCAYIVFQTVQRHGVYSAAYGTVHYKEPLKSFEIIRLRHRPSNLTGNLGVWKSHSAKAPSKVLPGESARGGSTPYRWGGGGGVSWGPPPGNFLTKWSSQMHSGAMYGLNLLFAIKTIKTNIHCSGLCTAYLAAIPVINRLHSCLMILTILTNK